MGSLFIPLLLMSSHKEFEFGITRIYAQESRILDGVLYFFIVSLLFFLDLVEKGKSRETIKFFVKRNEFIFIFVPRFDSHEADQIAVSLLQKS